MITVMKGGEEVKISKRAGSYVTLRDLIDWTSRDAVRFFLISRKADTEFVFDIDLALKRNDENPVFYVQYAHARICSVLALWQAEHGAQACEASDAELARLTAPTEAALMRTLAAIPRCWRAPPTTWRRTTSRSTCARWRRAFHTYYAAERFLVDDARAGARAHGLAGRHAAGAAQRLRGARHLGAGSMSRDARGAA